MSLLTACQAIAKTVGLSVPDQIFSSNQREWVEAIQFANEAGSEVARRVDWGALTSSSTLTGDGTNKTHTLPADYDRLTLGGSLGGVRPLSRAEWDTLTPVEGTPRYYLLEGSEITLWPYLANAATLDLSYQSKNWSSAGSSFMADTDTVLFDQELLEACLVVRWRRQKGMDYADFEAEYEAMIADRAAFDRRRF